MSGEISVINTIDTAHEDMIVSYCYSVPFVEGRLVISECSLFGVSFSFAYTTHRVHVA